MQFILMVGFFVSQNAKEKYEAWNQTSFLTRSSVRGWM